MTRCSSCQGEGCHDCGHRGLVPDWDDLISDAEEEDFYDPSCIDCVLNRLRETRPLNDSGSALDKILRRMDANRMRGEA